MKKTILTFLIFWGSFTSIIAQDSDYAAVEKTVNYYLNGGTNGDYKTLAKAFHKNATMKYIRNGEYTEVNALAFFKKVIKPGKKSTRTTKVTSITVAGDAANAVLRIHFIKMLQ